MYDIQRIGKLVTDIDKYVSELSSYKIKSAEDLSDSKTYHASSMLIFAILNRLIDLGTELLAEEKVGAPNSYQDIMLLLAKANVINKEQANLLNNLVKKRNLFAHFYGEVTSKDILTTIKDLSNIAAFLDTVKKRIRK
jgi:uncharacterized protein YutE (UPF0331/DUF86 family)